MRSISLLLLALANDLVQAQNHTLSAQPGPYPVTISEHEVRTNRTDPLSPTPQLRRLMVTVYRPQLDIFTCPSQYQTPIPYVPSAVAQALEEYDTSALVPASVYETFQLINCSRPLNATSATRTNTSSDSPIVLFSHGLQGSRYIYATSLLAVASSGYTVVAIDHTYDAVAVVFPDGSVAPTNVSTAAAYDGNRTYADQFYGNFLQPLRIADARSVLDAIESNQLPGFQTHHRPLRTAMYGHSLGGSTSAGAVMNDTRIITGMDIDGEINGFVKNLTITKPFVLLGEEQSGSVWTHSLAPTWVPFYENNLKGWKAQANVNNTVHLSFSDGPMVVDALGVRQSLTPAELASFSGTIDSRRNLEVGWRLTVEWLDFVFKGKRAKVLEGDTEEFPDVIVRKR